MRTQKSSLLPLYPLLNYELIIVCGDSAVKVCKKINSWARDLSFRVLREQCWYHAARDIFFHVHSGKTLKNLHKLGASKQFLKSLDVFLPPAQCWTSLKRDKYGLRSTGHSFDFIIYTHFEVLRGLQLQSGFREHSSNTAQPLYTPVYLHTYHPVIRTPITETLGVIK